MKTRDEIIRILSAERPRLSREYRLNRLALFGSRARGDAVAGSDVDILVDVDPAIGLRFVSLADELESLLGERVDVVSRRAVNPRHWKHIEPDLIDVA